MHYFQHQNYGLCVKLENTAEFREFADKLQRWQEQLNTAEAIRLDSVLLQLTPPDVLIQGESVRWHRRAWTKVLPMALCVKMFGTRLRRLFYYGPTGDGWSLKP